MLRVCGSFERAKASITTKRLATGSEDRLCNHSWYGLVCMVSCLLITLSMDHFSVSIPSKVKWVWCGTESNPCWGLACETVANSSLWRDNYFPSHILIELCMYQLALYISSVRRWSATQLVLWTQWSYQLAATKRKLLLSSYTAKETSRNNSTHCCELDI